MPSLEQKFEELTPKQVFKWLAWILAIASAIGAAVFIYYFLNFNGQLSQKQEIWGVFGDYIGGTLNPVFSFLALVALLLTIVLQSKELEQSRNELKRTADASATQAAYFSSQQKREDIYKLIIKLSERINNNYNKNHLQDGGSIHRALRGPINVNENKYLKTLYDDALNTNTMTHRVVKYIESDLLRLKELLVEYDKVSVHSAGPTPFPQFYRREYCEMVEVFQRLGLFKSELYEFYCQQK
ncbi:MAG: hypothetical protein KZQ95_17580 [Candidatus Thiodiazotropha sp. (ex Epidulcina cf. delphinae)]|nr:hypothetical protein [Candidatus Thiodiazotropha sp. (ex Epidulcina cf. delphinae)]